MKVNLPNFINSVTEFVSTCMQLFEKQNDINRHMLKVEEEHLQLLNIHQNTIKELVKCNQANVKFITEHEERIINLEKILRDGDIYREIAKSSKPN